MKIVDERNFIEAELKSKGFEVFDFFENHKVYSVAEFCDLPLQRRSDVLIVDTQTLLSHPKLQEGFKSVMNTFLGVIFLHEHSNQKAQEWVQNQAAFLTKIVAEYSLPMPQLQWTMFSNQLNFFWSLLEDQRLLQKHITQFSQELDQVLQTAVAEVGKARRVHEVLIPRRNTEIKGIQFFNKYATGDGGGGEFYDLHQTDNKVFQILLSSQSYLISSALMGLLNLHKKKKDFSVADFLKDAQAEIQTINGAKKKKSEVQISVFELNLATQSIRAHGPAKAECYSQPRGPVSFGEGQDYHLERGEKIIVFSPGFIFNWMEGRHSKDIGQFIREHQSLGAQELLLELFFQLRQVKKSDFLKKDATVVMMEVNKHGMHQV